MLTRLAFALQHFENVDSFASFARPASSRGNSEKIRQADQFSSLGSSGQRGRPTEQQRNTAGRLKEVLFLPAVMVAKQIAVVGKKTDENVLGFWSRFHCIENSPQAIVQISEFAIVTRLYDFR